MPPDRGMWVVRAYAAAGEATIYRSDPDVGESDRPPIPESEEDKLRRAKGRAVKRVRLYSVTNGLTFLWTLTWAPSGPCGPTTAAGWCGCGRPRSFLAAMSCVSGFVRRLRDEAFHGRRFPYVVVPEPHKDGHWHLHMLLGRFIGWQSVHTAWGFGRVNIQAHQLDRRAVQPQQRRRAARAAAGYAAKYIAKGFDDPAYAVPKGTQRYRVGEGFQPLPAEVLVTIGPQTDDQLPRAIRIAGRICGGSIEQFWDSATADTDWKGPRTLWMQFGTFP